MKLRKTTPKKTIQIVRQVLSTKSKLYGIPQKDYPLILAMIKYETNFTKGMKGAAGEVGLMQVIPYDKHIKEIVQNIKCDNDEKYCKAGYPDTTRNGKLSTYMTRKFLEKHPHYALETGLGEFQFWKSEYKRYIYKKWKRVENKYSKYTKKKLNDILFINHYNWGGRILTSKPARYYGINILKYYNKLLDRKLNERYR
jgi:hypothetical protein